MDISKLPFNEHLGLSIGDCDGEPCVVLKPGPHHLNHLSTVHATVMFGIAEAASGQCLLARFPDLVDAYVAMLRNSTGKYRRPGMPDTLMYARGRLSEELAAKFYETLTARGRASVEIAVSVAQGEVELFSGTFAWFVAVRER